MKNANFNNTIKLKPVGYSALVRRYSLKVISHHCRSFISLKGRRKTLINGCQRSEIYTKRYDPGESIGGHLTFALKFEGLNLEILSMLFQAIDKKDLEAFIKGKPCGKYTRKIWFLYEFLTGKELDLRDIKVSNYVDLLDTAEYYTAKPKLVKRQKVNNNFLGDKRFCPIVRKTGCLKNYIGLHLDERSRDVIGRYSADVLQRAFTYLYTKETMSSFEIERTAPDKKRAARFVELLKSANERDFFNKPSLLKLQQAIVDQRFANYDYRSSQNYVGQTVNLGNEIIHFAAPKPQDIPDFMEGMFYTCERMVSSEIHPVIIASVISFGFVFMHPFADGNGRIHRFLMHNILARTGFTPEELIFPVSAVMLRQIKDYDATLELFSKPLMPLINFELDNNGRMTVTNETAIHYRYIDMTSITERFFGFIQKTIETELPLELNFLLKYDKAKSAIQDIVDMPDTIVDLFIRLCIENNYRLSKNKRHSMFGKLTDKEITRMQACVQKTFT